MTVGATRRLAVVGVDVLLAIPMWVAYGFGYGLFTLALCLAVGWDFLTDGWDR